QRQFPGSEPFWQLLARLFAASWRFQCRQPVLPPRNLWDIGQLLTAIRPDTFITVPFALMTVGDALRLYGLYDNDRLRTFLDMQLKLYSQVDADETALLYAATALSVSQAPQGLFHLKGSMQVLSDRLVEALQRYGGQLHLRHTVEDVQIRSGSVAGITVRNQKTDETFCLPADEVVANVTAENLLGLVADAEDLTTWQTVLLKNYRRRLDKLPAPSGAFVIYLGVDASAVPADCPPHLQFLYDYGGPISENNSLFVSVSRPGDGRAPAGKATIVASSFVEAAPWWRGDNADYAARKEQYVRSAIARLSEYFDLGEATIVHAEAATPRTFARFTARDRGSVGGVGQRLSTFGPFGFATRTPIDRLWLVGDSVHPGEGTAGVSYSAQAIVRQIEAAVG
ncbi:MAG: C-3',4' desaturase CrtD, partial [Cyanobacteria bacterium J06641_5]